MGRGAIAACPSSRPALTGGWWGWGKRGGSLSMRFASGRTGSLTLVTLFVLTLLSMSISGCTFWARLPDGRMAYVTLPDWEVQRFTERMDGLSLQLLQETRRAGLYGLARVVTELREAYFQALRQIGAGKPADFHTIVLKLKAFEWQFSGYLTFSASHLERYRAVRFRFESRRHVSGIASRKLTGHCRH